MRGEDGNGGYSPVRLVIFDCDGVLVDSEPLAMRILLEAIAEAGAEIGAEAAYDAFLGKSLATVCAILSREHGVDFDDGVLTRIRTRMNRAIRRELRPIPGVADTLERLCQRVCVASSSQVERIRLSLEVTGLARFFGDDIFSAAMVPRGKPAPDLFLHAAQRMHVAPEHCIVIEDSPAGIAAARAAGMGVLGFVGGSHAQTAAHREKLRTTGAITVFDDIQALPGLLRELVEDRKPC